MKNHTTTYSVMLLAGLTLLPSLAQARIYFYASTDAAGNFLPASAGGSAGMAASWTGSGTVQPGISSVGGTVINDFTGMGELAGLSMQRDGTFADVCFHLTAEDPALPFSADIAFVTSQEHPSTAMAG